MGPDAAAGATWLFTHPALWREAELMRWLRSGEFARALLDQAGNDGRLQAYAYGYMVHVAAAVTSQPFINAIAGGPYRSHWWRQRLIANYVDTWVHGFYGASASMTGDEPQPPYEEWPDLCGAKLYEKIDLGLGLSGLELVDAVLDRNAEDDQPSSQDLDVLAEFLSATATATYGADAQLNLSGLQVGHDLTPEAFRRAYTGLSAVLWLQTGGEGDEPVAWRSPLCARDLQTVPPRGCDANPPDWVEEVGIPPQPSDRQPKKFSIIALLMFLLGRLIEAIHSLIKASEAEQAVWSEVRCTLYWTRYMVRSIELKVAAFLVESTLAPPSVSRLGGFGDIPGTIGPARDLEGRPLTRTTVPDPLYPRQMDKGTEGNPHAPDIGYLRYPTVAPSEIPEAEIWPGIGANRYPNFAIDGHGGWPLHNGGIMAPGVFPTRTVAGGSTAFFGNAVENAVQVIRANAAGLEDYNLDADRGYGWLAWKTTSPDLPAVPPFEPDDAS